MIESGKMIHLSPWAFRGKWKRIINEKKPNMVKTCDFVAHLRKLPYITLPMNKSVN